MYQEEESLSNERVKQIRISEGAEYERRQVIEDEREMMRLTEEAFPVIHEYIKQRSNTLMRKYREASRFDEYGDASFDGALWDRTCTDFIDKLTKQFDYKIVERSAFRIRATITEEARRADALDTAELHNGTQVTKEMNGVDFERLCANILTRYGWKVSSTSVTGDQGVDLIAKLSGITCVIQCKRWEANIGNPAVQQIIAGRIYERASHAAVVSNSKYTNSAKRLATASNVALLHVDELGNLESKRHLKAVFQIVG